MALFVLIFSFLLLPLSLFLSLRSDLIGVSRDILVYHAQSRDMPFAQLVIGPPGSGKTTYCHGMQQFMRAIGRPCVLVNLDPANDGLPYQAHVDISDLIRLEDVMEDEELGPNGGLIFCMEYLEKNLDWLEDRIRGVSVAAAEVEKGASEGGASSSAAAAAGSQPDQKTPCNQAYFIFDLPGQVELFINHESLKNIINRITKSLQMRFCAVHLVDSSHCTDPSRFISVLLLSLQAMLHLELPHINVLSKVDLMETQGELGRCFGVEARRDFVSCDPLASPTHPFTLAHPPAERSPTRSSCNSPALS